MNSREHIPDGCLAAVLVAEAEANLGLLRKPCEYGRYESAERARCFSARKVRYCRPCSLLRRRLPEVPARQPCDMACIGIGGGSDRGPVLLRA